MRLEPWVVGPITRTDIVQYQGASGDFNPIHHDEPFATGAGYPSPLGIGMLHAGLMNTWAVKAFGPHNVRRTRMRWQAPVHPGDTLTIDGEVNRRFEHEGERRLEVEVRCSNQHEAVVCRGWLEFVEAAQ